jgi:hypothetical protein
VNDQVSHPYKATGKIIIPYILILPHHYLNNIKQLTQYAQINIKKKHRCKTKIKN